MRQFLLISLTLTAVVVAALAVVVSMQPENFRISRKAMRPAPPDVVFAEVNNFHNWEDWSPWAKLDPNATYTYEGAEAGEGAKLRWAGNSDVGEGNMTILKSVPDELIEIRLEFLKPFAAVNTTEFTFTPAGDGTEVTWTMSGKNNVMGKAFSLLMDTDAMIGGQFEEGLANMKREVEGEQVHPVEPEAP